MSHYVITNESSSDIYLEDIGIRLSGRGSSAVVGKPEFESSKSVKSVGKAISYRLVEPSIWPFSARKPAQLVSPPPKTVNSSQDPKPDHPAVKMEMIAALKIIQRLDKIVAAMENSSMQAKTPTSGKLETTAYHEVGRDPSSIQVNQFSKDPVFIPSSIIPKDAEIRVNLKESESERPDLEETAKALKKMRKK